MRRRNTVCAVSRTGQSIRKPVNGISVVNSAGDVIGGTGPADANLISGNGSSGIVIAGESASGTVVFGNRIGTDVSGAFALPNGDDGVFINGTPGTVLGGTAIGAGNVISGNAVVGVQIYGAAATGNAVVGNRIGTDAAGLFAVPNGYDGIFLNNAPGNAIGPGNVISGNGSVGVQVYGVGASGNVISGDVIGANAPGTAALPNRREGVFINNAPAGTIGPGNLISGNGSVGVQVYGASSANDTIIGNAIGLDANGRPRLGNPYGIYINGAPGFNNPGRRLASGNVVAGNRVANVFQTPSASPTPMATVQSVSAARTRGARPKSR